MCGRDLYILFRSFVLLSNLFQVIVTNGRSTTLAFTQVFVRSRLDVITVRGTDVHTQRSELLTKAI